MIKFPHKILLVLCLTLLIANDVWAKHDFIINRHKRITLCYQGKNTVVETAIELLNHDCERVFENHVVRKNTENVNVLVYNLAENMDCSLPEELQIDTIRNRHESFVLSVNEKGQLVIVGSDNRGTAYGVMQLSRLIGVSPWEWWADVSIKAMKRFKLPCGYYDYQQPMVAYRGIFINDEDWGMMPWSSLTYEKSKTLGLIGEKTHTRIFELLLRLRANYFWPAMHSCSIPFYKTPANQQVADKYGIIIGTSHCEPMACNSLGEWPPRNVNDYNYLTNRDTVLNFWEHRVKQLKNHDIIYTLGMRGIHDGQMAGVKGTEQTRDVLTDIINEQRKMLARHHQDITSVPQVFIPYKEVLDAYNAGLQIPDDVTLMWCDDNYGYIRHFPTQAEQRRTGGNGIYYHVSYWGRPHDYLWLPSTSPALIAQQMTTAYAKGIRKMWMLNVGDIKPSEHLIELFLDMAWNPHVASNNGIWEHYESILKRDIGLADSNSLLQIMKIYYQQTFIRRPESMGNTRTEEKDDSYKQIRDLPWTLEELKNYQKKYDTLVERVEYTEKYVDASRKQAYFELVKYPVMCAANMSRKFIVAQLARHGYGKWEESDKAYYVIDSLTQLYNKGYDGKGKWNKMMVMNPRNLVAYSKVAHTTSDKPLMLYRNQLCRLSAADIISGNYSMIEGLGHSGKAISVECGESIKYKLPVLNNDSIVVEVRLLPVHPVNGKNLCFTLITASRSFKINYETQGRSEEWKENVLNNVTIRRIKIPVQQSITLKAETEGVIFDYIDIYPVL